MLHCTPFQNPLPRLASLFQTRSGSRNRLIQQCLLAGSQHHDAEALWPFLTIGDSLRLIRERNNRHDAHAVRVDWNGCTLGYIPATQSRSTASLLDQGKTLEARIGTLKKHANPWQRIGIEIWQSY